MTDLQRASILDDQPAQHAYLDFKSYSRATIDLITHPDIRTPLRLGVVGRWSISKMTLQHILERRLKSARLSTVWFNA